MKKIDDLKKQYEKTKAEMGKLEEEIKKLEENKGKWKPNKGETYYYVDINFNVARNTNFFVEFDREIVKYNKVFKTEKEAQDYADYLKALKEASYEFTNEEWNDANIYKYYIYYDYRYEQLGILATTFCNFQNGIYFETKEETQFFIGKYKKQILKYEFEIEEE